MKLFLATPITQIPKRHASDYVNELRRVLSSLRERDGITEVFCAFEQESWGADIPGPAEIVRRDERELRRANILVVYYPVAVVSSVLVEIGWAHALRKPIVFCCARDVPVPTLVQGLIATGEVSLVEFETAYDLTEKLAGLRALAGGRETE